MSAKKMTQDEWIDDICGTYTDSDHSASSLAFDLEMFAGQARQDALREAAKAVCYHCENEEPLICWDGDWVHDLQGSGNTSGCDAHEIHQLLAEQDAARAGGSDTSEGGG